MGSNQEIWKICRNQFRSLLRVLRFPPLACPVITEEQKLNRTLPDQNQIFGAKEQVPPDRKRWRLGRNPASEALYLVPVDYFWSSLFTTRGALEEQEWCDRQAQLV